MSLDLLGAPAREQNVGRLEKVKQENLLCSSQEENHQKTDSAHPDLWLWKTKHRTVLYTSACGERMKVFMTCKVNLSALRYGVETVLFWICNHIILVIQALIIVKSLFALASLELVMRVRGSPIFREISDQWLCNLTTLQSYSLATL